ncbi:MAG: N-acetylmuramoyl-L-alanine amidase [Dysgonomonas sp.]
MKRIYIIFFILLFFIPAYSFSAPSEKDDRAQKGEGIYAFLKRNGYNKTDHYEQFIELNKKQFKNNTQLIEGVRYQLPSTTSSISTPSSTTPKKGVTKKNKLFGKKYEKYTIKSDRLKGACFFLSSGHGGPDSGAVGKVDGKILHEDEYAYDITLRLARNLLEEGATVHIIIQDALDGIRDDKYLANSNRETCMGAAIPLKQVARLKQRSDKINSLNKAAKEKYKRAVFIHLDSRSKKQQIDVFFYYSNNSVNGKKLANTMRNTFDENYKKHQPNRGFTGTVSTRSLYVLNNTTPVGIFTELGNIQNSFDQRRFLQSDNRQALANWMCRGFIKDYENWKK